jgi:hypothetical protein
VALEAAREQVINAANVIADTALDLIGKIGRTILDNLAPARRLRLSPERSNRQQVGPNFRPRPTNLPAGASITTHASPR